ncbi:unnamed protein product [Rotaria socialis]|nr:unnamed protein product [Rotaria socialis]CAF3361522.1 unnamed protein product [Rotaria socialis]CAF3629757.1 unnamed protein product [Rotaria socialis]CAF4505852.1 unnamed protein product [Rotaria socialis]CAF4507744.1 unnamed protein product [Rotaria socialis]
MTSNTDGHNVDAHVETDNIPEAQTNTHESTNNKDQKFPLPPREASIHVTSFPEDQPDISQQPVPSVIEKCSIYDIRTSLRRKVILGVVSAAAFLLPFCDTIYLPALSTIQKDLNTTTTLVTLSVSIYLIMNGVLSLLWGPITDRFGRKTPLIVALFLVTIASVACIFSPNIIFLIAFRTLQGASASATIVVGQAVISDIYPAKTRASATGIFFVPFLIGPVIGALIGGALSEAFGWRSTFVLLAVSSFVILIIVFFLLSETHQIFCKALFEKANPNKSIIDVALEEKPFIEQAWKPLTYLLDLTMLPYLIMTTTTFMALFVALTLFPIHLMQSP